MLDFVKVKIFVREKVGPRVEKVKESVVVVIYLNTPLSVKDPLMSTQNKNWKQKFHGKSELKTL